MIDAWSVRPSLTKVRESFFVSWCRYESVLYCSWPIDSPWPYRRTSCLCIETPPSAAGRTQGLMAVWILISKIYQLSFNSIHSLIFKAEKKRLKSLKPKEEKEKKKTSPSESRSNKTIIWTLFHADFHYIRTLSFNKKIMHLVLHLALLSQYIHVI